MRLCLLNIEDDVRGGLGLGLISRVGLVDDPENVRACVMPRANVRSGDGGVNPEGRRRDLRGVGGGELRSTTSCWRTRCKRRRKGVGVVS